MKFKLRWKEREGVVGEHGGRRRRSENSREERDGGGVEKKKCGGGDGGAAVVVAGNMEVVVLVESEYDHEQRERGFDLWIMLWQIMFGVTVNYLISNTRGTMFICFVALNFTTIVRIP